MVQKVLEGLREEAFELARDIGVDVLTQPGGLRKFVEKLRDVVFPRASTQPLMKNPRQGTPKTQKATVKSMRTTSYPSPKQLPLRLP